MMYFNKYQNYGISIIEHKKEVELNISNRNGKLIIIVKYKKVCKQNINYQFGAIKRAAKLRINTHMRLNKIKLLV